MSAKNEKKFNVVYGEAVGAVAAHSFGEPSTQMVLRTFHSAGIASSVVTGLPRILELVDARKKQKSPLMTIRLEKGYAKNYEKSKQVKSQFEEVLVKSLLENFTEDLKNVTMSLEFDKEKLSQADLTLKTISGKLQAKFENIDIEQEGHSLKIKYKSKKEMKSARTLFVNMRNFAVKGLQGIKKATVQQEDDGEFYIITSGSNMAGALEIDGVDKEHIYSNDMFDVLKVYGIEAARNTIANELKKTMDEENVSVGFRHIGLLADAMTYGGSIKSAGRHGIAGNKASVFARASYEETVKHFVNASVFGERDPLKGVSENILIGKQINVGTGRIKLAIKKEDLKKVDAEK